MTELLASAINRLRLADEARATDWGAGRTHHGPPMKYDFNAQSIIYVKGHRTSDSYRAH